MPGLLLAAAGKIVGANADGMATAGGWFMLRGFAGLALSMSTWKMQVITCTLKATGPMALVMNGLGVMAAAWSVYDFVCNDVMELGIAD